MAGAYDRLLSMCSKTKQSDRRENRPFRPKRKPYQLNGFAYCTVSMREENEAWGDGKVYCVVPAFHFDSDDVLIDC